jgi:hypothetical protein
VRTELANNSHSFNKAINSWPGGRHRRPYKPDQIKTECCRARKLQTVPNLHFMAFVTVLSSRALMQLELSDYYPCGVPVSSTLLILQMVKRPRNKPNGKERHQTIWQLGLGSVDTGWYTVAVRDKTSLTIIHPLYND